MRALFVSVFGSKLFPCLATIGLRGRRNKMIGIRNVSSSNDRELSASQFSKMVILEGNIGVGKTTLACRLGRELDYRVMLEPTAKNPYLAKFYKDPKSYALKLQLWIFRQRFTMYVEALKHLVETGKFPLFLFLPSCSWKTFGELINKSLLLTCGQTRARGVGGGGGIALPPHFQSKNEKPKYFSFIGNKI